MNQTVQRGDRLGFTFTETMGGYVAPGDLPYAAAARAGRTSGAPLRFVVTILADDLASLVHDSAHQARMAGTVDSPMFGGTCPIENGTFNLFIEDDSGRKQMRYRMVFSDSDGKRFRLEGFKDVHNDYILDVWKDTTTLFTTIRREDDGEAPIVATGILKIRAVDLVPQVLSMRALNPRHPGSHVRALASFGWFFTGRILHEYMRFRVGRHGNTR
jgi:cholesterol oxidase